MKESERYVAEIEIQDGYLSIDCQAEPGEKRIIKIFLNHSSVDESVFLANNDSVFIRKLLDNAELELITDRKDIESFLKEVLTKEFGENADIEISNVDYD